MPRITISYRRDDSGVITGRIFDRLVTRYGQAAIFRDIDNIPIGVDFRQHIERTLGASDIVLAIVGPHWIGSEATGNRLASEADPVRVEIEAALRKGVPLIPVLVLGAAMPRLTDLPESLHDFAYRNAVQIDAGQDFDVHMGRLTRALDRILGIPGDTATTGADVTPGHSRPNFRRRLVVAVAASVAVVASASLSGWYVGTHQNSRVLPENERTLDVLTKAAPSPPALEPQQMQPPSPENAAAILAPMPTQQMPPAPTAIVPPPVPGKAAQAPPPLPTQQMPTAPPASVPHAPNGTAATPSQIDAELLFWQSIERSTTAADFQEYLRQFPKGRFAGLARNRIAALHAPPAAAAPAARHVNAVHYFTWRYDFQPEPGLREWTMTAANVWVERYPSGRVDSFHGKPRADVDGCSGLVVARDAEPNFEVFIPDLGCPQMLARFRRDQGNWSVLGEMHDIRTQ